MNINDSYKKNTMIYKDTCSEILQTSYKYTDELIIFITLASLSYYYPPFEISRYLNILKENNIKLPVLLISDDINIEKKFKDDMYKYFNKESTCTSIENITINVRYKVNFKKVRVSNLIKLDDLKLLVKKEFNIVEDIFIVFSNEILLNNKRIGEYFIEDGYTIYIQN